MAGIDHNIAMNFRLPQMETPFQSLGGALTLRNQMIASETAELERQRRIAFDNEVKSLPEDQRTTENLVKIASKYAPAKDLYHYGQQSMDRAATNENTRQVALARLQQAAKSADAMHAYRMASLTRQEDKDAETKRHNEVMEDLQRQAATFSRGERTERLYFDTGVRLPHSVTAPAPTGPASPQAQAPQEILRTGAPTYKDALAMFSVGGGHPMTVSISESDRTSPILGGQPAAQQPAPSPPPQQLVQPTSNNLDVRDMFAQGPMSPQAAAADAAQRAAMSARGQGVPVVRAQAEAQQPAKPVMPDFRGSPREVQRARNKWLAAQSKSSIAGGGIPSPQTLEFMARQYLTGDRQVVAGFARSVPARIAIQEAIVAEAQKQKMSPEQTAAQIADFAGTMAGSRTVGQRAANISLAATEAQEMLGIVRETSGRFARTNFVPWNMAIRAYETNTGSPEIAEFGAALNALVNVYARAINPTGVPTISDKEHARAVINTVQSPQQVEAVLNIINRELEIAKKAPRAVQEATRRRVTGSGGAVPAPPPGFKVD